MINHSGADNIFIDNFWVAAYNAVYTANQILANVDAIEDPSLMDEVRSDVKGEALTVRAMAHFDLLRTFGEHWDVNSNLGIPLVLDATDPLQARGRNTVQECYDAILADLNNALVLVSNDDVEAGDGSKTPAYITQYFVNGLLARVYLYMQDYENASVKAAGVINDDIFIVVNNPALIYTTKLSSESILNCNLTCRIRVSTTTLLMCGVMLYALMSLSSQMKISMNFSQSSR